MIVGEPSAIRELGGSSRGVASDELRNMTRAGGVLATKGVREIILKKICSRYNICGWP